MAAILQHIEDNCCTLSSSVSSMRLPVVDHFSDTHKDIAPIIFSNCLPYSSGDILSELSSWFHSILFTIFARQRVIEPERQKLFLVILTAISSPYIYRDCGKHLIFLLSHSRSRARVRASGKAARNEVRSPSIILLFTRHTRSPKLSKMHNVEVCCTLI